eukprot:Rhum_TRINITY_DN18722_c0_g1::Rhum_TRINITY_DN18722_c0_g1_i1::g.168220::m.168220
MAAAAASLDVGGLQHGRGEWHGVPRVVRETLMYLLRSVGDLQAFVSRDGALDDLLLEKAGVVDVHQSLALKVDAAAHADAARRIGDRVADVSQQVASLTQQLADVRASMGSLSWEAQAASPAAATSAHGSDVGALRSQVSFLAAELLKDRDDFTELHARVDLLSAATSAASAAPLHAFTTPKQGSGTPGRPGGCAVENTSVLPFTLSPQTPQSNAAAGAACVDGQRTPAGGHQQVPFDSSSLHSSSAWPFT